VNSRTAVKTTVLPVGGGVDGQSPVLVPKGTMVGYSEYSMQRDPRIYGMDAAIFNPDRWDEHLRLKNNPTASKWSYLPFNGGPRVCLGSELFIADPSLRY
jgi:cytochrome P450